MRMMHLNNSPKVIELWVFSEAEWRANLAASNDAPENKGREAVKGRLVTRLSHWVRYGLMSMFLILVPFMASTAPYAALVMDARTGEVLYSTNADTRLHPASLTKMMTLYVTFEAIERGEISLDTMVTVSARAAAEQPSRLGLRAGQKIALRYLIRAAAIKSANDAATAIAEAVGGSVPAFAARMNRTANAIGMKNSTFKNANGLTETGHLSTARDLTLLGRRLFYDYPEYYNLFSRRSADAGMASVSNTNARFLDSYEGADGIKTGFTQAAGFNLTASAERSGKRIIATVMGGTSTPQRNAKMAELLDLGFSKAPSRVREVRPAPPVYPATPPPPVAQGSTGAKTVRVFGLVTSSPRPTRRPAAEPDAEAALVAAVEPPPGPVFAASEAPQPETLSLAAAPLPIPRPETEVAEPAAPVEPQFAQSAPPQPETLALLAAPTELPLAAVAAAPAAEVSATLAETVAMAETPGPAQPEPALADASPDPEPVAVAAIAAPSPLALSASPRPLRAPRPALVAEPAATVVADNAVLPAQTPPLAPAAEMADAAPMLAEAAPASAAAPAPVAAETDTSPVRPMFSASEPAQPETMLLAAAGPGPAAPSPAAEASPVPRPEGLILTALTPPAPVPQAIPEVITRLSTSGGQGWGVSLGKFTTSYQAERVLLQTALMEAETLGDALRKVANRRGGFDATFVGMPQELAEMACRRLVARQLECSVIGP
jgi:D-alanyl-D-alanine carboxypeptidase